MNPRRLTASLHGTASVGRARAGRRHTAVVIATAISTIGGVALTADHGSSAAAREHEAAVAATTEGSATQTTVPPPEAAGPGTPTVPEATVNTGATPPIIEDPAGSPALDADGNTVLGSEPAARTSAEIDQYSVVEQHIIAVEDSSSLRDLHTELAGEGVAVTNTWDGAIVGLTAELDEGAAHALRTRPGVVTVEPDHQIELSGTQSGAPWNLDRLDQRSMPLDGAFSYVETGLGVTAYVIDSGVRPTHVEFGGRASRGAYLDFGDGTGFVDCHGHGTHVAGTIGGATWGVAKAVTIVPVKVVPCSGTVQTSSVLEGINWVIQDHQLGTPAVVNLSLGAPASNVMDSAVAGLIADGITVVAASGNAAESACSYSPARVAAVITVAASTSTDDRAGFSNFGGCNDLFAPGVGITSASYASDTGTAVMHGTSMAAPHVAGAATMILQRSPAATPEQVWQTMSAEATRGVISECCGDPDVLLHVVSRSTPPRTPLPVGDGPGVASALPGQIDVFARGQDDGLYVQHFNGLAWGGWNGLGGIVTSTPAAAARNPGQLDVFVRGQDNALWTRFFDGASWSPWVSLGGILTTAPAVVSRSPNTLDVFVAGYDGALYTRHFSGFGWSAWTSLGGVVIATPAVASSSLATMTVFARGQDSALWARSFNGSTWSGWVALGGIITTAPGATSRSPGTIDVFARGQHNDMWTRTYNGSTWGSWFSRGGILTSPAAAVSASLGLVDVFVRGTDNALWANRDGGGGYVGWYSLGGILR